MIATPKLKRVDTFIQRAAKKATKSPVYTRVAKKPFKDKDTVAQMKRYKPKTKGMPIVYEVVYDPTQFKRMQAATLERVGAHELAHIKHPNVHTPEFVTEAKRLGAGNRSGESGINRRK